MPGWLTAQKPSGNDSGNRYEAEPGLWGWLGLAFCMAVGACLRHWGLLSTLHYGLANESASPQCSAFHGYFAGGSSAIPSMTCGVLRLKLVQDWRWDLAFQYSQRAEGVHQGQASKWNYNGTHGCNRLHRASPYLAGAGVLWELRLGILPTQRNWALDIESGHAGFGAHEVVVPVPAHALLYLGHAVSWYQYHSNGMD